MPWYRRKRKKYQGEVAKVITNMRKEKKYKLSLILKVVGMSKSTYYFLLKKDDFDIKNNDVIEEIKILFKKHKQNYGVRRVTAYLKKNGFIINHKKVHRLMKKFNLSGKKPAQKYHSYQGTVGPVAPNLLERNFSTTGVNENGRQMFHNLNLSGENAILVLLLICVMVKLLDMIFRYLLTSSKLNECLIRLIFQK